MATTRTSWGFDISELDHTIRPQDDFFHHASQKWIDANSIPLEESRWGSFMKLRKETDEKLHAILKAISAKKNLEEGSTEQILRDFFVSGMDSKKRNKLGASPLLPLRALIDSIESREDLEEVIATLHRIGVDVVFSTGIDQDAKNATRYVLHVAQGGIGLPDRDYYLKTDAESTRVLTAYKEHVEKIYVLMGRSPEEAKAEMERFILLETKLAKVSMRKEDTRDADKTYHKMTLAVLKKHAPEFVWKSYMERIGAEKAKDVIVMQPQFIKAVSTLLDRISLSDWKSYMEWHLVNDSASLLSEEYVNTVFDFYGRVLMGAKEMKPLWRRVLGVVNGQVGELLGKAYVEKYFSPEAKKKMLVLVKDLMTAYEARLESLDWMSAATKKKALKKLKALNTKIGYPDKWKTYKGLRISPDDYFGNVMRTNEFEHKRAMKKLVGAVDRKEWFMYPQTVNAYFAPNLNDIVFPAAILQPPFFSVSADDALNYGSIGTVIGHEITHGFDDQGCKFDEFGNLKSWWTKEDKKRFEAKAKKIKKQYDQYVVADGVHVNGALTLGENIADLGGLSIAYDAYQLALARTGRKEIDGLSPEERFFIGFSLFEREHARDEFQKMQVLTDPHSPGKFRINGTLTNFNVFYDTYGVTKGDKLFRAPKDREMVW
ncbi:MAG: M13 family metallopeptidase [Candidatus Pacebacteria bacterium]|nr:M13 family metallopeptidase [Candidatus Paceibacterota bacterium]